MSGTAGFAGFPEAALDFYEGLEADNSKTYWTAHKQAYEDAVRRPMLALLTALEPEFGSGSIFRPYRDVRFSKDKTPYKTQCGAFVRSAGGGFYVAVSAAGIMVAGGYYDTATDQVERLRAVVADDVTGPDLERVLDRVRAGGLAVDGVQLKTRPRGVAPDAPRLDLLRHKTLYAWAEHRPAPWLHTPAALDRVRDGWQVIAPLNTWLDAHVGASRLPADRRR